MEFDLAEQRAGAREQLRIADLMSLAPGGDRVLEIGARDCYLSRRLTALYREVTALDLRKPEIDRAGNRARTGRRDGPRFRRQVVRYGVLHRGIGACAAAEAEASLRRDCAGFFPLGLDRRALSSGSAREPDAVRACGAVNPTTGHLSRFDRGRLEELFPGMEVRDARLVGRGQAVTNPLSVFLYRLCGYPYGSYAQEEGCVHCGAKLVRPEIGPLKWAVCFPARALNRIQYLLYGRRRPLWIHVLFEKKDANRIKTE